MKQYTAIYSSESIKNIQYSFKAESIEAAVSYCQHKFSIFPAIVIIENTESAPANFGSIVWSHGHNVI